MAGEDILETSGQLHSRPTTERWTAKQCFSSIKDHQNVTNAQGAAESRRKLMPSFPLTKKKKSVGGRYSGLQMSSMENKFELLVVRRPKFSYFSLHNLVL